jgi:hypothetical protein
VRIDVRPVGKLRGQDPIDLMSSLGPVIEALRASDTDLSRVRIACDWIQYRASWRWSSPGRVMRTCACLSSTSGIAAWGSGSST